MTFKHNGRLHRFAYNWHPDWRETKPVRTSVCSLFWRTVFSLFVAWPFVWGSRVFGWVVRIVLAVPAFILFGMRPAGPRWRCYDENEPYPIPFVPIGWWPKVRGWRFQLGTILFGLVGVSALGFLGYLVIMEALHFLSRVFFTTSIGEAAFGLIVAASTAGVIYAIVRDTEGWQMVRSFAKAKIKRFCPIVEFN